MTKLGILGKIANMEIIAATEASNKFGHLLDMARAEPVTIEKQGRAVVVMMAIEEYERMEAALERIAQHRLAQSIADMEAGNTIPARDVFAELKNKYGDE